MAKRAQRTSSEPASPAIAWPADKIERRPLSELLAYARNARLHSDEQVDQIAASIKEFGWTNPVIIDENNIIVAGHGRCLAAEKLGIKEVPCVVARGWSDAQKRAYRLADNQIPLNATYDHELLRLELGELAKLDFDLKLIGFDDLQLVQFMAGTNGADPESTPEPPAVPVSRCGDLWVLGGHRLLVGDATKPEDVARVMNGKRAVLMNTDPPYGINYGDIANSRDRAAHKRKGGDGRDYTSRDADHIENDDLSGEALQAFLEATIKAALPHLIPNPAFYLWHPMLTQGTFFAAAAAADILIHRQIIWVKPSLIMGRGDYHWRHELCFYGWIRGKRCAWLTGRDQDTVWQIARENDGIHPTQKPTELFTRPIQNHTKSGDIIFEPFSGSGSQIIAAQMSGRRCFALDVEPIFVDVAVLRWQKFSGDSAKLESTGQTFDEVAKARSEEAPEKGAPALAAAETSL